MLVFISRFILQPLRFLLRFMDPTMRTSGEGGVDVIDLATGAAHPQERGYFTLLKKDVSAPQSLEEGKQQDLWEKTLQWTGTTRQYSAL